MLRVLAFLVWFPTLAVAQTPPVPTFILAGHTEAIAAVAISPDGRTFATGSFDKTIKLWDAATGKDLRTLGGMAGHTNLITAIAFAPKEPLLASASTDNTVKVWDVKADKPADAPVRTLAHPQLVNALAFHPGGNTLATGGQDGLIRLWDISKKDNPAPKTITAHVQTKPQQQARSIYSVKYSADGKQLISTGDDRFIKIWDVDTLKLIREIQPGSDRPPPSLAFRATVPAVISTGSIATVNFNVSGHTDQVYALALSPDGKSLASGSADRLVKLWTVQTGELLRALPNATLKSQGEAYPQPSHPGYVQAVKFSTDGTKLYTVGTAPKNCGYLAVWSVADGKMLAGWELPCGAIHAIDAKADGTLLLGCGPKARGNTESQALVLRLPEALR